MTSLLDRQLLVVTGKGGTGKTVTAAALARLAAKHGKSALVCEVDSSGDVGRAFEMPGVGFDAVEAEPNVHLMQIDTEQALQEYMRLNLKLPLSFRAGPLARVFDFVATAAPGVREILTMGKVCWEVKRENYDIVILDASSSGYVLSQLGSPDSVGELVSAGPLPGQTAWMRELLSDADRCAAVIVTAPEELPVDEAIELTRRLQDESRMSVGAIVVNRVLPQIFSRPQLATFEALRESESRASLAELVDGDVDAVFEAVELGIHLRERQTAHLEELQKEVGRDIPLLFVPQDFETSELPAVASEAMSALAGELEQ